MVIASVTAESVRLRVAEIAAIAGDPEKAHSMEDGLREDVLMAIAEGAPHPILLANLALKTRNLKFPRWAS